jgi:iron complex outermembrane receptor protein
LSNFALFDIDRVEVLRGPQNTIFGRNTTGGAVQFVSHKPSLKEEIGGYIDVNGGNKGRIDVEGAINARLSDTVAVRLSGARFARGDYLDNLNLNKSEGAFQRSVGRLQLLWQPSDAFSSLINVHGGNFNGSTARYKQIGLSTPGSPGNSDCPYNNVKAIPGNGCADQTGFIDSGTFTDVWANSPNVFKIRTHGASLRFDWHADAATFTSLSAYEYEDSQRVEDSDAGPSYIFNFYQQSKTSQYSQEFRLASPDNSAVKWIAGLYYFQENADWTTVVRRGNPILTNATTPGLPVPEAGVTSFMPTTVTHQKNPVYSAYGQIEFKATEKLRLTAGLRFSSEKKEGQVIAAALSDTTPIFGPADYIGTDQIDQLLATATQVGPGPLRINCPKPLPLNECYALNPFSETWNTVGGKVALDYHFTDEVLGYASIARGFKAGSISVAALDYLARGGSTATPETLWTYELGLKSQWLNNRVRLNGAFFYNRWTDEQLFLVSATPTGPSAVLTNVPKTESYGVEAELTWAPTPDWYLMSGIGGTQSKVKDAGDAVATVGSVLIGTPKLTWNGLVRRDWGIGPGRFGVQGNWTFTGSQHFDLINSPDQVEPSYWLFNAAANYRFGDNDRYEASLWGKNLTRTQYCFNRGSLAGVGFSDTATCYANEGTRFFGIGLHAKFE